MIVEIFQKTGEVAGRLNNQGIVRYERAASLYFYENIFLGEDAQRFPNRDAAYAELPAQFALCRELRTRRVFTSTNALSNRVLNLVLERNNTLFAFKHGAQ